MNCNFNYYRREVCSFLSSAAGLWMDVYHCDGIRMDAISRALYWQGDPNRGVNQGAVNFLRSLNHGLNKRWPTGIYMAEDSTNFLKVTAPTRYDGVGFDYKWDMGWMHDTLDYFATPFGERPYGCGSSRLVLFTAPSSRSCSPARQCAARPCTGGSRGSRSWRIMDMT